MAQKRSACPRPVRSALRRRSQVANAVVFPGAVVMGDFGDVFLIDDVAVAAYPPAQ